MNSKSNSSTQNVKVDRGGNDLKMYQITLNLKGTSPTKGIKWPSQLLDKQRSGNVPTALFTCEEAAIALLEVANQRDDDGQSEYFTASESSLFNLPSDIYTPIHFDNEETAIEKGDSSSDQRIEAAQLFVKGCLVGMKYGTTELLEHALRLAKKAVEVHPSPMTYTALAWVLLNFSSSAPGRFTQDTLLESILGAASSGLAALLGPTSLNPDDQAYLARLSWLMALVRDVKTAELGARRLLAVNSEHYMGMLLLALLHTVSADYGSARSMVTCMLKVCKEEDIAGALLHIMLRQVTENTRTASQDSSSGPLYGKKGNTLTDTSASHADHDLIGKELAIVLARVKAYSERVTSQSLTNVSSDDHTAPVSSGMCSSQDVDDFPSRSESSDSHEAQHRAAHYWSLLAHICTHLGAYMLADVAIEAGMNFIISQSTPHQKAFANLLCTAARLTLLRMSERYPFLTTVHELNLLRSFLPFAKVAPAFTSLTSETKMRDSDSATGSAGTTIEAIDQRELSIVFTHLLQAVEMCPNHADAHFLMGTLRLLDASQPDLPKSEKHVKLLEAAVYFERCIDCCPFCIEAYMGLGSVRKAQEADEVVLDLYGTAAELSFRKPLIPFEEFLFLLE